MRDDGASAANEPAFREPWEARAFALVLELHERGLYTWPEWTRALAHTLAEAERAGDRATGEAYYRHWLHALESLVAARGLSDAAELQRCRQAWEHAAARTPHGQPIELQPGDFSG